MTSPPGDALSDQPTADAPPEPALPAPEPRPVPQAPPETAHVSDAEPAAAHEAAPSPAAESSGTAGDPTIWGRVDEEGTVWVNVAAGERRVGSYPGAAPEEALAYFARKYDELAGQVRLLEQRMAAGGVSASDAAETIDRLRGAVADAKAVGDLAALAAQLDVLTESLAERKRAADARREAARERTRVAKTALVTEAESLAESTDWKKSGDRMRVLLDEWKAAPKLDRNGDSELWKRLSRARTIFEKRRRAHFAQLDVERAESAQRKEKLVKEAEELSASKDWAATAAQYRQLMTQWKSLGRARRDVEDALWERFKAAQDAFFAARNSTLSVRDAELKQNLGKKEALLTRAESLLPVGDVRAARGAMRAIHEQWEAAGHVPRTDRDQIERRLKQVDDAIRAAEEASWKRSNPEARARAQAAVAQLQSSIEQYDRQAAAARAAGQVDKADKAEAAAAARRTWLAEAQRTLEEFS